MQNQYIMTIETNQQQNQAPKLSYKDYDSSSVIAKNMTRNRTLDKIQHFSAFKMFCKDIKDGEIVVEIGPWEGHAIEKIANTYNVQTIGIDAIDKPQTIQKTKFIQADLIQGIPLEDNSVDKIYSFFTQQYLPNNLMNIPEIYKKLKPGGRALIHIGLKNYFDPQLIDAIVANNDFNKITLLSIKNDEEDKLFDGHYILDIHKIDNKEPHIPKHKAILYKNSITPGIDNSELFFTYKLSQS